MMQGICALIKNVPPCDIYEVLVGYDASKLNTTCYTVSNVSSYLPVCTSEQYANGPSFFDRLDGRLNLSSKYVDQSVKYFDNPYIGIETLVSPYDLDAHGVTVNKNATWIDYLYWQNKGGCPVTITCQDRLPSFKLDCPHAYYYNLSTSCVNASSERPVSHITSPHDQASLYGCPNVNINGTASDCDGQVSQVNVLINGVPHNTTWDGSEWTYTLVPSATDIYVLQSMAIDDSLVQEIPFNATTIFVYNCSAGDETKPSTPALQGPTDGETGVSRNPTFYWGASSDPVGIYKYLIQVDDNPPDWNSMTTNASSFSTQYYQSSTLQNNHWYAWRVRAQDNSGNWGNWSQVWTFKT